MDGEHRPLLIGLGPGGDRRPGAIGVRFDRFDDSRLMARGFAAVRRTLGRIQHGGGFAGRFVGLGFEGNGGIFRRRCDHGRNGRGGRLGSSLGTGRDSLNRRCG